MNVYLTRRKVTGPWSARRGAVPKSFVLYDSQSKAWVAANPQATPQEKEAALRAISKRLTNGM